MKQLITLVWLISALPLAAQQVVSVNSGEHDGYSRLVLRIDPEVEWELIETRGEAVLRFPAQTISFSTARVFDRITTARIAALSAESTDAGSELRLELPCDCEVQAFAFNNNYIVLDVYDGPELEPEEAAQTNASPLWQPDALPFIQPPNTPARFTAFVMAEAPMQPQILPDPPRAEAPSPAPQLETPAPPDMVVESESPAHEAQAQAHAPPAEEGVVQEMEAHAGAAVSGMNEGLEAHDDPEMLARIEEAQTQLLAQLTRAADQGLVDFVPAPVEVAEIASEQEPMPEHEPDLEPTPLNPELLQQLSARTAYANGTEDALSDIVNEFAMPQCLNDAEFSMEGWGGEDGFSNQLASLRSQLLGEFDAPDAKITEEIVQLYLRYGLGAEARLMLKESGVELDKAHIYNDMASLIEGEPERVTGPVSKGAGCGGAHEMWYLATGTGDYQVLEPLTITDAFSAYPIEVRSLIGPPLAQAFIRRGQVEAGHVVLEIVRRAENGVTPAQRMAEAQVLEAQDDMHGAAEIYRALALSSGEAAPQALISYARTMLATGEALPETLLVDLESAAFFNRETEAADALRLWEIRVRAEVSGAEDALAQIEENLDERPHIQAELKEIAADILVEASAAMIGDYPYAQMVLQYAAMLDQGPAGDAARLKIAQEMASIGLPETALDMLAPNLTRAHAPTRHVQAAAYVQLFEPEKAVAVLAEDSSLAAYKIRLNAYLQMEDFSAVAEMLNETHAKEISVNDVALRAGDWEKIQDAGAVGTLATYVQGVEPVEALPPMMAEEAPTLKAARALLEDNAQSTQFLEDMLAEGE